MLAKAFYRWRPGLRPAGYEISTWWPIEDCFILDVDFFTFTEPIMICKLWQHIRRVMEADSNTLHFWIW